MRSPAEDGRLQQIIALLRCHVSGIGCPNFTRFAGAVLPANHVSSYVDWPNLIYYNKATNTYARGEWDVLLAKQHVDTQIIFNPNIDNGAGLGKGRHLTFDVDASKVTASAFSGRKPIGMAHDRGINQTDDTIWVGYYEVQGDNTAGRVFVHRFRLTDEDGTTWNSTGDLAISLESFPLGSRGQFGGTSGVAPFNLTPVLGNMRLIGVNEDGHLMVGATTKLGEEFMLLYSIDGASKGDLMDISPTGLNRADYSASLGTCDFEDGSADDKRAVRSLVPLFVGQWSSEFGTGSGVTAITNQWNPILIDDDRHVFYFYGMPCSRFGGHGPIHRFEETQKESVRDIIVIDQDNIRNRLDVFGLKSSAAQSLNGYNLNSQPSNEGWWRAESQGNGSFDTAYEYADDRNTREFQDPPLLESYTPSKMGGLVVGARNLVLGKKDLIEGGVTLNDADVIISGGKEVYFIPDEYIPNGYQDGSPI